MVFDNALLDHHHWTSLCCFYANNDTGALDAGNLNGDISTQPDKMDRYQALHDNLAFQRRISNLEDDMYNSKSLVKSRLARWNAARQVVDEKDFEKYRAASGNLERAYTNMRSKYLQRCRPMHDFVHEIKSSRAKATSAKENVSF
eukprot:GEMP01062690.1.p1 GENE.GEMP01062690.1~~GEMP01062690.1.p1  ORF type:complete len:145 (+),score=21.75 GEMP01062690.1:171-605(+)